MDGNINYRRIVRSTGIMPELIGSCISMAIALFLAVVMLYVFFRDVNLSDESAIFSFLIWIVIVAIFGGLFGYFFGYRNFKGAYKLVRSLKKGEYTIKEDFVSGVSTYRYRNSLHYKMALKNCKEKIACSRNIMVGQKVFIVYSLTNKVITYITTEEYAEAYTEAAGEIAPEEKEKIQELVKQPEEVEINGRKIVVGEKEKAEEQLRKEYSKFLTPMYIIDFALCAVVLYFSRSMLSAMLCFAGFIFAFFGFSGILYELQFKLFGRPVKVKITDVKKIDTVKKATMEFEYNGEIKTLIQNIYFKTRTNMTYDALYVPWTKSISVKADKKDENVGQTVCVITAIALLVGAWLTRNVHG